MHGHALFPWSPTPARLVVWTLRVIAFGRRGCVGHQAALSARFGAADAAAFDGHCQVLAFAILRAGGRAAGLGPPFNAALSPLEEMAAAALAAAERGDHAVLAALSQALAGPGAGLAAAALLGLAALAEGAGESFCEEATPYAIAAE